MYSIKELIERYNKCLPISDKDIQTLYDFYEDACLTVDCLGPEFLLFKKELHQRKEQFAEIVLQRFFN